MVIGKQVVFVTNNSTKSRADYQKKLNGMGVPATAVGLYTEYTRKPSVDPWAPGIDSH